MSLVRAIVISGLAAGCGGQTEITLVEPDAGALDAPVVSGPAISQVLVNEQFDDGSGATVVLQRSVFGVPLDPGDDGEVTGAILRDNRIIIEIDQPLRASRFWNVVCRDNLPAPIPDDAVVDDIARCTGPDLTGCTAFCADRRGIETYSDGSPLLTMSRYDDETVNPDKVEFGIRVTCDGVNIPISGSGASLGLDRADGLLELQPPFSVSVPFLRSSAICEVSFHDEVVGFDDNRVCAPPGGDVASACSAPGEVIRFETAPMTVIDSGPEDGEVDVRLKNLSSPMDDKTLLVAFNVALAQSAELAFALTENGAPRPIEVSVGRDSFLAQITVPGGLVADASYTLSFGDRLTDKFGGRFPGTGSISFTAASAP